MSYNIGDSIAKNAPLATHIEFSQAVNDHNAACQVGDTLWIIEDGETCYTVAEGEALRKPEVDATPSAEDDLSALVVDHEYRLTLLELGITEDTDNI